MAMGYISQVGPANAEEGLTPNTQNHTTVWNVGNTSPVKDTTNNSKWSGDAFEHTVQCSWVKVVNNLLLELLWGEFSLPLWGKKKKVLCVVLLTFSHTVRPLHSPWQAGERKYSYSHERVNTVAVSSETCKQIHHVHRGKSSDIPLLTLYTHSHPNTNTVKTRQRTICTSNTTHYFSPQYQQ